MIGITVETIDKILQNYAFTEYVVEMDSLVLAERDELVFQVKLLTKNNEVLVMKVESLERSLDNEQTAVLMLNRVLDERAKEHRKELRRVRWKAWRDRIIMGLIIAGETYLLLK